MNLHLIINLSFRDLKAKHTEKLYLSHHQYKELGEFLVCESKLFEGTSSSVMLRELVVDTGIESQLKIVVIP